MNGAGLAALATQQALVAAGPASATGMETHAVATVTTSVGSASARTILRVPTVRFARQDTMGTPGASGTCGAWCRGAPWDKMMRSDTILPSLQSWRLLLPGVWGPRPPHQRVLGGSGLPPFWGTDAPRWRGGESWAWPVLLRVGCLGHRRAAALRSRDTVSPAHPHLLSRQQHPLHSEHLGCGAVSPPQPGFPEGALPHVTAVLEPACPKLFIRSPSPSCQTQAGTHARMHARTRPQFFFCFLSSFCLSPQILRYLLPGLHGQAYLVCPLRFTSSEFHY